MSPDWNSLFDFGHEKEHKRSCHASMYMYNVYLVWVSAQSFTMLPIDIRFVEIQVIRLYSLNFFKQIICSLYELPNVIHAFTFLVFIH